MADRRQTRRHPLLFVFRIFLGLALFTWLALLVDWSRIAELLRAAEPWALLGVFLLIVATRLLTALKWTALVHAKQLHPP